MSSKAQIESAPVNAGVRRFCIVKLMNLRHLIKLTICIYLFTQPLAAQSLEGDSCIVAMVDANKKAEKELGKFDTLVGEEERTMKDFSIPDTPYHALASVFYTDESWAAGESMFMELLVSKGYNTDPLKALHVSTAELLIQEISAARVSVLFQWKGKPYVVIMECRRKKEKAE